MQDAHRRCRVVVLGGYGHFGGRIVRALAQRPQMQVIVAGRSASVQGVAHLRSIAPAVVPALEFADLDIGSGQLHIALAALRPDLVIHTAGPFQGQGYAVAHACLRAGAHYVDLADGRGFVREFAGHVDAAAQAAGRAAVTGASTLPALSSAVVDALRGRFDALEEIDIVIAPAQRTPLGRATVGAVLSYCGERFDVWRDGRWQRVTGWRHPERVRFARMAPRLASPCDVPDHDLLVARYPGVRTMRFRAALELPFLQRALALLAVLRQYRVPVPMRWLVPGLSRAGRWFDRFGSELGGMSVVLRGRRDGQPLHLRWDLTAPYLHGPEIPCLAAVLLARRVAAGDPLPSGAQACMGLLTLRDFEEAFAEWGIDSELGLLAGT